MTIAAARWMLPIPGRDPYSHCINVSGYFEHSGLKVRHTKSNGMDFGYSNLSTEIALCLAVHSMLPFIRML